MSSSSAERSSPVLKVWNAGKTSAQFFQAYSLLKNGRSGCTGCLLRYHGWKEATKGGQVVAVLGVEESRKHLSHQRSPQEARKSCQEAPGWTTRLAREICNSRTGPLGLGAARQRFSNGHPRCKPPSRAGAVRSLATIDPALQLGESSLAPALVETSEVRVRNS